MLCLVQEYTVSAMGLILGSGVGFRVRRWVNPKP